MSLDGSLRKLSLEELHERCAQETFRFFHYREHDPRFCFEIFRRAFAEKDEAAWGVIYLQYEDQVSRWVKNHPAFSGSGEEGQFFVNRALEKFWNRAFTPEEFGDFRTLNSLLAYLKMCVHTVIVDHWRANEREKLESLDDMPRGDIPVSPLSVEDTVFNRLNGKEIWGSVKTRFKSEKEYRVMYGVYGLNLKPREILSQWPDMFESIQDVYRTKENVLARLRRDEELHDFLLNLPEK